MTTNGLKFSGPVLILSAHPDDEMGCAGFVSRLIEDGQEVHHYYFSTCAESTRALGLDPEQLLQECERSRDVLGIPKENRGGFDFPVRHFPAHRQEILETLVKLRQKIKPRLILTTSRDDIHQDHSTLTTEAFRAFKHSTILGFELPWNITEMHHDCFITLEKRHVEAKIASLKCYQTQNSRNYSDPAVLESLARVRGGQINTMFAECYEAIRIVL